jgi:hypothetical protein
MITDAKLNLPIHAKHIGILFRPPGKSMTGGFADTAGGDLTLIEQEQAKTRTRTALEVARKA